MSFVRTGELILAHGIGGRADLPVPLWLAMYGGATAVLVSFFALAAFWTRPRLHGADAGRPLPWLEQLAGSTAFAVVLRGAGVLLLAGFLIAAWAGPNDDGSANPAPTWIYVWFWVGLVPLSVLLGPVWRRVNPLRTLAAGLRAVVPIRNVPVPSGIGYWPAVAGLAVFLWMELVYDDAAAPRTVAVFVTAYAIAHVVAGGVYEQAWFDQADSFEVYTALIARASPLGRRADGRLVLRNPLDGLAGTPLEPALTPVVLVVLGSTAFDGLSRTPLWSSLVSGTGRAAYLGLGTTGLVGSVAVVAGTYALAIRLTRPFLGRPSDLYAEFAHSIIPIAIGYTIAHYFSFAIFQGQQGILLANDPLVRGWDLFGLAGVAVDYEVVSTWTIAFVQVAAIVIGHVVAVTAAHDRSVAILPERNNRRGQYPMLVLMVCYTITGIALLSGA